MKRFKNILFVLGNRTNETSPSLMRAIALTKTNQADLTLLHVLPKLSLTFYSKKIGMSSQQLEEKVQAHEEARLHQLLSSLDSDLGIRTELKVGKRYIETIRAVQSENFDLVIKEADSIDWFSRFLGSDDMHLLRKCPCPVWLMKKDEKSDYRNIMAADERRHRQHRMDALLEKLKSRMGEESYHYLSLRTHIVPGIPGRDLPKMAETIKADLVVMGTVAHTGIAGVIVGNTAEAVLSQLNCSVLAIKPEGFKSPIFS